MCNVNKGFKFCTCADLSQVEFTWRLTRYLGEEENAPMGSIVGPSHDLGKGLTARHILEVLNGGEGFDFAYVPAERDSLYIRKNTKNEFGYMSFLFVDGVWTEGMNSVFSSITEELGKGEVDV